MQRVNWTPVTSGDKSDAPAVEGHSAALQRSTIRLPSSIWNLVSLLILGCDGQLIKDIIARMEVLLADPSGTPELAVETLQVRTFPKLTIGCVTHLPRLLAMRYFADKVFSRKCSCNTWACSAPVAMHRLR